MPRLLLGQSQPDMKSKGRLEDSANALDPDTWPHIITEVLKQACQAHGPWAASMQTMPTLAPQGQKTLQYVTIRPAM